MKRGIAIANTQLHFEPGDKSQSGAISVSTAPGFRNAKLRPGANDEWSLPAKLAHYIDIRPVVGGKNGARVLSKSKFLLRFSK